MGPPPDPEHMASMLENPNFQSTLNEALQNPEIIEQMIRSNPMLRDMGPHVRQMMQDPTFRRMMTDPESLRNLSQMQRQMGGGGMGMLGGMGGRGGDQAFPMPGVTDTTPGQPEGERTATPNEQTNTPQTPLNPFAMFGPPGAAGGAAAGGNPFAALFGPGVMEAMAGNAPTSPPAAGDVQTPGSTQPGSNNPQQPANPIATMSQQMMQNPQLMQQLMGAMGGMGGNANRDPSNPEANSAANAGFNPFAALQAMGGLGGAGMGGLGGLGGAPPAPPDDRAPEDRYAEQLRQLNDMGFYEFERNVEALRRTGGSVQGAVEYLLTH